MAKTYIGYAQREKETNVNWGAVATGFTDLLNEQRKTKEDNEAADALATEQLATTLQNSPEGGDRESSDYILDYVNNASNYNLMLKRQLDSGNMSRKQFTTLTQNLTNGTAQIVAITKKYNGYLQNQEKRMKEATDVGGQAAQDIWNAGKVQSFADFRDNAAFIDPTTMKVSQGKLVDKVVDGKTIRVMSENTGDFTQVSTMLGWMGQEIDKFDLNKAIDDTYKTLAPSYQTNADDGSVKDDIRNNPKFEEAVNKKLGAYLNDPRNVASILADYAGMSEKGGKNGSPAPWEFTDDVKRENNPDSIYLTPDSAGNYNIDLKSKQGIYLKEQALDYMKSQLDLKIPKKTTAKTSQGFDKNAADYQTETLTISDNSTNWMALKNADNIERFDAAKKNLMLRSRQDKNMTDITAINQSGGFLNITYFDPNTNQSTTLPISMSGSNLDFLNQGETFIGASYSEVNQRLGKEKMLQLLSGERAPGEGGEPVDFKTPNEEEVDIPYSSLTIPNSNLDKAPYSLQNYLNNATNITNISDETDATVFAVNEIFTKQTNPNKALKMKGMTVRNLSQTGVPTMGGKLFELYLPEVMTAPIFLDAESPSTTNAVVREIYNAINEGKTITPRNLQKALGGEMYRKQESIIMNLKKKQEISSDIEWNDGMGKKQDNTTIDIVDVISTVEPDQIPGYVIGTKPTVPAIYKALLEKGLVENKTDKLIFKLYNEANKHHLTK